MSVRTVGSVKHTWSPAHPHAKDKQWTIDGKVWKWKACSRCTVKTAVREGGGGKPICDECFEKEMKEMEGS